MSDFTSSRQMRVSYERMREGDLAARDEFFALASGRLMALARKIKRDFPGPGKLVDTGDVVNDAYLRLHRSLEQLNPPTVQEFFRLTALKIRQVLLDLCDKVKRIGFVQAEGGDSLAFAETTLNPVKIAEWTEFHRCVNALPAAERQVVDLLWYHDLTAAEAAEILEVDPTTVRRRWRNALLNVAKMTGLAAEPQRIGR